MRRILAGIETEYGLQVEGSGAESQVEEAMALVRSYPGECLSVWDYRHESPRSDLRGFKLSHLAYDPEDAKYDEGRTSRPADEIRSDRILPNGARFYNDHGHPEYSTPECWSLHDLVLHDQAGQVVVHQAARAYAEASGREVKLYKNNTDFHGASYGTHENYLVPRKLGYETLFAAVLPMLVVRQVLSGAGKVGSESGAWCDYQLSQRADFFVEPSNTETLYRRPIFNTRDEPHANPNEWIRLHVISGDANMTPTSTALKVGLVKLAVALAETGVAPTWKFRDPVKTFQAISRDRSHEFAIELERKSWTTAREILESYFAAAEAEMDLDEDLRWVIALSRHLLDALHSDPATFRRHVDWAAKQAALEQYLESEQTDWRDAALRAFDLEYHNVDPDEGLWFALQSMDEVEAGASPQDLDAGISETAEPTRAKARGHAVRFLSQEILTACWKSITFRSTNGPIEVELPPDWQVPPELVDAKDVETFIRVVRGIS